MKPEEEQKSPHRHELGEGHENRPELLSTTPIIALGASGLVGSRFVELTGSIGLTSSDVDIRDRDKLMQRLEPMAGMHVVNFAAFTDVDGAEKQRGQKLGTAWQINVIGAQNVAEVCREHGIHCIHISTDFIFPGTQRRPGPYKESAGLPKNMDDIGWYGWTKRMAEAVVTEVNPDASIVRVSYPYGPHEARKLDFAGRFLKLYDDGRLVGPRGTDTMPVFNDQVITPTYIDEAVDALVRIAELKKSGVFHVASRNACITHEFARLLIELTRGEKNAPRTGKMSKFLEGENVTPRPQLGGLNTKSTQNRIGMTFMSWDDALKKYAKELRED